MDNHHQTYPEFASFSEENIVFTQLPQEMPFNMNSFGENPHFLQDSPPHMNLNALPTFEIE